MRERTAEEHIRGVVAGDRAALGRAITLVESTRPADRTLAHAVLRGLPAPVHTAHRIGVTGPPGAGKSTLIEAFGMRLVEAGHRVAVLAVDPSSLISGGSILGDKTRMQHLANHDAAYVRPSPARGALGGVALRTGDAITLVEAAGYDIVLVETVGVGQSEVEVAKVVDTLWVVLLAGAGDELQGIKKGLLEAADVLAVNKADGAGAIAAERARRELEAALHLVAPRRDGWERPVLACSALTGTGLDEVWAAVQAHHAALLRDGRLASRRGEQRVSAMWEGATRTLAERFRAQPDVVARGEQLARAVSSGAIGVDEAVARLLGDPEP